MTAPARKSALPSARLIIVVILIFVAAPTTATFYVDARWYAALGYGEVLATVLGSKALLGLGAALLSGLLTYGNLRLAARLSRGAPPMYLHDPDGMPRLNLGAFITRLTTPASLTVAAIAGALHYREWERWLLFRHGEPFGDADPIFGRDIGFYIFTLPFLELLASFALFASACALGTSAALYAARGALQVAEGETRIDPGARGHLAVLSALVLSVLAGRAYLDSFEVLHSTLGPIAGASYADVHATLPAVRIKIALTAVGAVLMLVSARREGLGLAVLAIALYLGGQLGVQLVPGFVQRFTVKPNELGLERQYIEHNIRATRAAYGLDTVVERDLDANTTLSRHEIEANADTLDNIRLWDHQPLLDTFAQIQEIRTYYDFAAVDNDRYMLDGKLRQTMLSARELSTTSLPNRTWITEHLTFTHGYGLTVGPVNEASTEGLPMLFVRDIPPVSSAKDLRIARPAIYFGELSSDLVFVRTHGREFDYPAAEGAVETDYAGKDGIGFSDPFLRTALAVAFGSVEVLLSNDIHAGSRALLYRNVRGRLARVAPFLVIDNDPYMVVRNDGTLAWICDAYTVSDRYPYSEPSPRGINYIRNAVKAVVDAYDGTVSLYVADETDPMIRAYQKAFPTSFHPLSQMPTDLRAHLRYPELVFDVQSEMFSTYHMASAELLYNREDQWEVPAITSGESKERMHPYYTVMKLPDERAAEFILMLPFTPKRKDNLAAWMVARSDGDALGELMVYRFPKDRLVFGPQQVVNRINQDAEISRQISLWDQRGSKAEFGTLLVVPIEQSLIYVRPLYLRSEGGRIPELKRVIVVHENRIAMAPSLREAVDALFRTDSTAHAAALPTDEGLEAPSVAPPLPSTAAPSTAAPSTAPDGAPVEQRALLSFERAIAAQRAGDWARYGAELAQVEALLRAMQAPAAQPDSRTKDSPTK